MANMSYCRFENTYQNLKDCYEALTDDGLDGLSVSETKYANKLIQLAKDIAGDFDPLEVLTPPAKT